MSYTQKARLLIIRHSHTNAYTFNILTIVVVFFLYLVGFCLTDTFRVRPNGFQFQCDYHRPTSRNEKSNRNTCAIYLERERERLKEYVNDRVCRYIYIITAKYFPRNV